MANNIPAQRVRAAAAAAAGGETRLVGIPLGCAWQDLLNALERITAPVSESGSRELVSEKCPNKLKTAYNVVM